MIILKYTFLLNFVILTLNAQQTQPQSQTILPQPQAQLSSQLPQSLLGTTTTQQQATNLNINSVPSTTPAPILNPISSAQQLFTTLQAQVSPSPTTPTTATATPPQPPSTTTTTTPLPPTITTTTSTFSATAPNNNNNNNDVNFADFIPLTTIPTTAAATTTLTTTTPSPSIQSAPVTTPTVSTTTSSPFFTNNNNNVFNNNNPTIQTLSQANQAPVSNQQLVSNTNAITNNSNSSINNVQFLKPKSKFKCLQPSDCKNDGVCFNGACFCSPGHTGESCAINIDECRQTVEPCFNNGTCIDEINGYRCECMSGFKGERCQEINDMCLQSPCENYGKCINLRTDYQCICEPGWEGKECQKNINECETKPCSNNGTCYDLINDYRCDCGQSGFTGKNCEIDFDDCQAKPCSLGAKECVDMIGDYKCICHDGWTGKKCDEDIQDCMINPCENNGTCIDKSTQVAQLIRDNTNNNITLAELLTSNSDTLNISNVLASNNANMNNVTLSMFAGYYCECNHEYVGDNCEERKKCYTRPHQELCNHTQAECVNVGTSYECLINASFDGTGANYSTYKVNGEFKMKEIYIRYRSITGGIVMSFETTQQDSTTVDLQLTGSGSYLGGQQINSSEPMKFDEYLDGNEREIHIALGMPIEIKSITLAKQHQIPMNNIPHLHSLPFKGCLMQVRLNGQLVPLVDYYSFGQNHTFTFTENHLELGQCRTCFERDCLHGGHCEFHDGYDHCSCRPNYSGTFCELDFNECENKNVCANGATCENFFGGYKCNCKEGYRGEKCQEIADYCKAKQPCSHNGICKNININLNKHPKTQFECDCPSSHIGPKCERKRDCSNECHPQHSRCINNETCACLPGKKEERMMCEYVSSCEQVQGELCLNGGTCKNLETGGFHCLCPEPFYGHICELIEKPQFDLILLIVITSIGFLVAACVVVSLFIFRSVRKARATRGTYSPSTQEKFGNSASDLLKPPIPERLI